MAITVNHSTPADGTFSVQGATAWNDAHTLSMASDRILGRTTAGPGTVEELTVGTGLTLTAGSLINTAPDQVVSLTGTGTTSITGTYPSFTITSNDQYVGTVTSVAALTLGTTGTDLSSSVANGTTTPVITLNVPTASASNRGALSSADWSTFNGKQAALVSGTNIKTVSGASLLGSGDVGTIGVAYGGTGQTTYTNGELLIGNTTGNTLTKATLTAGTNVSITNGAGSITINATDQFVGTVTSVGGTGTVNGITLTGTVTSSGSLTLGGSLSGVSLTTQVSGTLPVANGGTGVTTSTGSGAVVLSTSPTLVTPTLGAASATSIANGLGAVGTPSYTFTGDTNTGMWSPAADTVAVSTDGLERMRIDSGGDVGIGTTNPLFPLHVNGEVRGTKFTSDAKSQSLADNTDLTVLTLTGALVRLFLVSVNTNASGSSDMTVALVTVGTDGSGGANATVTQLINGANTDITVANVAGTSTVSVKQTTGGTQTVSWSITRLM